MTDEIRVLRANPHRWGPGKIHVYDPVTFKTLCGKNPDTDCPGLIDEGHEDQVDCKGCIRSIVARRERAKRQREWEQRQREWERQRAEDDRIWWARYNAYLRTPEWEQRRAKVLARADSICEGCGDRPATIAHHLSYAHVCEEFLFELAALCDDCHRRLHPHLIAPQEWAAMSFTDRWQSAGISWPK